MRALLLALLAAAALADEHAFVEATASHESCFVHEPVRLRLRIGFDREFFRRSAVPLFPRAMDVPLQVLAPWVDALGGAVRLGDDAPGERLRLAVNDAVEGVRVAGLEERGGRAFTVLEIERRYAPLEPGEITLAAPVLRYVHATRFREDFVQGRIALDPVDATVEGAPLAIAVRALPEEGRPAGFAGAVGRFAVRAAADRTAVRVGEAFRLTLHVEGEGNLALLPPPRLDGLPGFHVFGTTEEAAAAGRAFAYEVAALDGAVAEVPPLPFAFFDPGPPAGYRVARTAPIPLDVADPPAARRPFPVWAVAAGALLLALGAWAWRRRRAKGPDPVREAATVLRAAPEGPARADALARLLALYLGCEPAAVIAPDLAARLAARGLRPDLAARAAAALERMVASRYGGGDGGDAGFGDLLAELEAAFEEP